MIVRLRRSKKKKNASPELGIRGKLERGGAANATSSMVQFFKEKGMEKRPLGKKSSHGKPQGDILLQEDTKGSRIKPLLLRYK